MWDGIGDEEFTQRNLIVKEVTLAFVVSAWVTKKGVSPGFKASRRQVWSLQFVGGIIERWCALHAGNFF